MDFQTFNKLSQFPRRNKPFLDWRWPHIIWYGVSAHGESAHTYTHTHAHTHAPTHTHTHAHTHIRAYTHARAHTETHAHTRTRAYAHMRTHTCARTHARTHTRARAHTRTQKEGWVTNKDWNSPFYHQAALQLHILFQTSHVNLTSPRNVVVAATILKSLLLFAFSHLSYVRYTRKVNEPAAQLELSAGAAALYLWRLLMLVSRVLILALFSSTFPPYTFVLVTLRFLVFLGIVVKQECNYFEDSFKKQCLFKVAVAYIHIFSFFPLISERTQSLGIIYYFSTFVENCTVLMLWVSYSSWDSVCRIVAVLAVNVSFAFGLSFLALYYRCFHPRIVEAHKTKSELVPRTVVDSSGVIHLRVSAV